MADEGPEADRAALRGLGAALGGARRLRAPLNGAIRLPSRPQRAPLLPAFLFSSAAEREGESGADGAAAMRRRF